MDRWNRLFKRFSELERARLEFEEQEREAMVAQRDLDVWCVNAMEQVMQFVRDGIEAQAAAFEQATRQRVSISYPVQASPVEKASGASALMSVNLGDARVLVYVQRNPGHLPFVHVLGPAMEGNNVQVRRPFCRIIRRPDDSLGFVRGDDDIDGALVDSAAMVDEIVFCTFELLIENRAAKLSNGVSKGRGLVKTLRHG
jgi:hypothetical protein